MNKQSILTNTFAILVAVLLLLITAFGNALALFIFSSLMFIIGVMFFRKKAVQGAVLTATVGLITAVIIALLMLIK